MGLNSVGVVGEKYLFLCQYRAFGKPNDVIDGDVTATCILLFHSK